jgi:hypothetical protein
VALDRLPAVLRFTELAKLVEPGQEPKTDKLSVLQEAIRCVQQMQVENSQLKQLNKFMEVGAPLASSAGRCVVACWYKHTYRHQHVPHNSAPCPCWAAHCDRPAMTRGSCGHAPSTGEDANT